MKKTFVLALVLSATLLSCASKRGGSGPKSTDTLGEILRHGIYEENFRWDGGLATCMKECLDMREKELSSRFITALGKPGVNDVRGLDAAYGELITRYESDPKSISGVLYFGWYLSGSLVTAYPDVAKGIFRQVRGSLRRIDAAGTQPDGLTYLVALEKSTSLEPRSAKLAAVNKCLEKENGLPRCKALKEKIEKLSPEQACESDRIFPGMKIYFAGKKTTSFYVTKMKSYSSQPFLYWGQKPQILPDEIHELRYSPEGGGGPTLYVDLEFPAADKLLKLGGERINRVLVVDVDGLEVAHREIRKAFAPDDFPLGFQLVPETADKIWGTLCPSPKKTK